jgi:hypothetical protein
VRVCPQRVLRTRMLFSKRAAPLSNQRQSVSRATGRVYTDICGYNASTQIVLCSHGTDLIEFPEWC